MGGEEKSKILIFGATGYLGQYMVKASLSMGHPTYAYTRPVSVGSNPSRAVLVKGLESSGVTVFQGGLEEHEKLVSAIQQVDVVISTLAVPQHLDQLKIINAIKEAGNVKRFVPSEFGNEVDRVTGLPPFQALLDNKKKIRRATEAAGIPYTFVSANSFAAYFVDHFLHPHEKHDQVTIYGTGDAKVVWNLEEDVAAYTIRASLDSQVANRVLIIRPPKNILSQLQLVSRWENKTGRTMEVTRVPEEDLVASTQTLPFPENIPVAILHDIFVKGNQTSFELREDDLEASRLFPDYAYTSVDDHLNLCLVNPPKCKLAAFA